MALPASRIHQVVALLCQTVHIVLDVGVAATQCVSVSIVHSRVQSILRFPVVSHAVVVAVGRSRAIGHGTDATQFILVGNEAAFRTQRGQLLYNSPVVRVTYTRGTHMIHNRLICLLCRLHIHGVCRVEVRIRHRCRTMMVGNESPVQHAVLVAVIVVAAAVEVIGLCPVIKVLIARGARSGDEVVVHYVLIVVGSRVPADDAHAIVVHHIIIILQIALHLRIAALIVGP